MPPAAASARLAHAPATPARAGRPAFEYRRRRPETGVLHRILRQHLATFEASLADPATGHALPGFVTDELRGYLGCGDLRRGFGHLRCPDCGSSRLVPFGCHGRGFCPSCAGRRMNETAANLVDLVLPDVPLRQFVLTLPYPLRYRLGFDGPVLADVLGLFVDTVGAHYRSTQAARGVPQKGGQCGAITVVQRVGSDLRLNPHAHTAFADGTFVAPADPDAPSARAEFHPAPAPSQADVEAILARASARILRYLQRRGVIAPQAAPGDGEIEAVGGDDELGERDPVLARLLAASVAGAPPAGPHEQRRPIRLEELARADGEAGAPQPAGHLCAKAMGFNLHAATTVSQGDARGRETLMRYMLRPPIAQDRLRILPDGRVEVGFKKLWRDGTKAIALDPLAFIGRLAAAVPFPRLHTVRYHGVFAPRAKLRPLVVPDPPPPPPGATAAHTLTPPPTLRRGRRYIEWAELLRRAFDIDVCACPKCGGRMRMVGLVKDPDEVRRFLCGVGLWEEPPALAPARPVSAPPRRPPRQPRAGPRAGPASACAVEPAVEPEPEVDVIDLDALATDPPAPDDPA